MLLSLDMVCHILSGYFDCGLGLKCLGLKCMIQLTYSYYTNYFAGEFINRMNSSLVLEGKPKQRAIYTALLGDKKKQGAI